MESFKAGDIVDISWMKDNPFRCKKLVEVDTPEGIDKFWLVENMTDSREVYVNTRSISHTKEKNIIDCTGFVTECSNIGGEERSMSVLDHVILQKIENEKLSKEREKVYCNTCKHLRKIDEICTILTVCETPIGMQTKYSLPEKKNRNYDCKDYVRKTSFFSKLLNKKTELQ
jgi:hypothetical protein